MSTFCYLIGQKLSNAQIEKMVEAYAAGLTATRTAEPGVLGKRQTRHSNTVLQFFQLLRERLLAIDYFPDPDRYFKFWSTFPDARYVYGFSDTDYKYADLRRRHRGSNERTHYAHDAEMLFRSVYLKWEPAEIVRDIRLAVRITGPLNRRPTNLDEWRLRLAIIRHERTLRHQIADTFRDHETADYFTESSRRQLRESRLELRRFLREKEARAAARKAKVFPAALDRQPLE